MSPPLYVRSTFSIAKRLRLDRVHAIYPLLQHSSSPTPSTGGRNLFATAAGVPLGGGLISESEGLLLTTPTSIKSESREPTNTPPKNDVEDEGDELSGEMRLPRSVQAVYLRPLKRRAEHGVPSCDLQLRSFSVRNLEFFTDFALRAAYYLNLPAKGPVPLPRLVERWTLTRSNFIFKKSQENFERITLRRLIQIQDGHPETVQVWLAFLRKHAYYGIGMKANMWNYEKLGVGKTMDVNMDSLKQSLDAKWSHFGRKEPSETAEKVVELMNSAKYRRIDDGPMHGNK